MRLFDDLLNNNMFWGVVFLALLLFGSRMEGTVRAIAVVLSWLVGSYWLYRWWEDKTAKNGQLLACALLIFAGVLAFIFFYTDPRRPVTRPVASTSPRGTLVVSATLLSVGGSPTQEHVPDPTDWVEPKTHVHLIFQDSSVLTGHLQNQLERDISAFREYLIRLGIPVSDGYPPIGVSNGPGAAQTRSMGQLPTYRSQVSITQGWFVDRRAVTPQYVDYAISGALQKRPPKSTLQDMMAASAAGQYFNGSFWNYKPKAEGGYWATPMWDVRSRFGKDFADRLLAFAVKSMIDSPDEGAHCNFDLYFYHKLQQGYSVIDSDPYRMTEITRIVGMSGIDLNTPKAYFDFSATAIKRRNGAYTIDVAVSNTTDVLAKGGQLRLSLAPDVRLLRLPDGAQKDPSTTLQAARIIPVDTIGAHETKKLAIKFVPVGGDFPPGVTSFILHFDYTCSTCGKDNYSHHLKFPLDAFRSMTL